MLTGKLNAQNETLMAYIYFSVYIGCMKFYAVQERRDQRELSKRI